MRTSKRMLAIFLALVLIVSMCPLTAFAADTYSDVPSTHWAYPQIEKWSSDAYGVLLGTGNNKFEPRKELTLAELVTILSKTFGYTERTTVTGLPAWADGHIEKAVAAGIITANAGDTVDLTAKVTREQAIKYIATAYSIAPAGGETTFVDSADISAEYKGYVKAFQKLGYVTGKGKNDFDPQGYYTRAESMTVINNITSEIIDKSITGQTYAKSLIVRKSNVTVADTTVKGDLIIGQGVGDGDVTLDNVTLNGQLIVYGGGSNSIIFKGKNTIQSTIVNKSSGEPVHLNGDFDTIIITEGSNVIITGTVKNLIILGNNEVTLDKATIGSIEVNGDNVNLIVNSGSTVKNVTVNANNAVISGNGIVRNVKVTEKAKTGVEILTAPSEITVDAEAGASKSKKGTIHPGTTTTTSNPSSGGKNNDDNSDSGDNSESDGNTDSDQDTYVLTIASAIGGSISGSSGSYKSGAIISLSASPFSGYHFVRWLSTNGGTFVNDTSASTTFTMPESNCTIDALFEADIPEDDTLLNDDGSPGEVSRAAWIARLVEAADLSMFNTSIESSFSDIDENNQYLQAIEIALQNNIISCNGDSPLFYPEAAATTAFSALTAVKSLGYDNTGIGDCFSIAQEVGLMDEAPTTDRNITGSEATELLGNVERIIDSTNVNPTAVPVIDLADEITELSTTDLGGQDYTYEIAASPSQFQIMTMTLPQATAYITVPKNEKTEGITIGDCILLPPTDQFPGGLAQKVVSVTDLVTTIKLGTVVPSYEEFMAGSQITVQGVQAINVADFVMNPEIVGEYELAYGDDQQMSRLMTPYASGRPKITIKNNSIEVEFSKSISGSVDANGSIDVTIPKIEYIIDLDYTLGVPTGVNELYLGFTQGVAFEGNIEVTGSQNNIVDGLEIGRIPIPLGATGFTVDLVLFVGLTAKGKIAMTYNFDLTSGIQYKDSRLRAISRVSSNLDFTALECTLEGGPNFSAMLSLFSVFDLADITAKGGIGINASANVRDLENICVDGTGYVYLGITALKNSLIGELIGVSADWSIWGKSNSPFKKSAHFEGTPDDVGFVPECTFGEGELKATLRDASTNGLLTSFAMKIEKTGGDGNTTVRQATIYAPDGVLFVDNLSSGNYKITITASGYSDCDRTFRIYANQTTNLGTIYLVQGEGTGTGSGTVTDALTASPVSGATVQLYSGDTSGSPIQTTTTDNYGQFSFTADAGYYTIAVSKTGYTTAAQAFVITTVGSGGQNVVLTESGGDLRIVLTWGANPRDLDSHLCGPTVSGTGRFHIYYGNMRYDANGSLHSFLDRDDTSSYGPETTTVYNINTSGKYSFYVHDYTNLSSSSSTAMATSGATVRVYNSSSLIGTFYVPSVAGTLWHVFDYNAATGVLTPRNVVTYQSSPQGVGAASLSLDIEEPEEEDLFDPDQREDIATIFDSLLEKE